MYDVVTAIGRLVGLRPARIENGACVGLLKDDRATTAIEFALLAVPFIGLLFAIIETAIVLMLGLANENATQVIARLVKTGQVQQAGIRTASDFRTKLLCPSSGPRILPSYMDCNRLIIDVRTASALSSADLTNDFYRSSSSQQFCLGGPQSIVIVRTVYTYPSLLPQIVVLAGNGVGVSRTGLANDVPNFPGWNHLLFSAIAFENEAYGGSAAC